MEPAAGADEAFGFGRGALRLNLDKEAIQKISEKYNPFQRRDSLARTPPAGQTVTKASPLKVLDVVAGQSSQEKKAAEEIASLPKENSRQSSQAPSEANRNQATARSESCLETMMHLLREQMEQIASLGKTLSNIASVLPKNTPMPVKEGMQEAIELIGGIKSAGQALCSTGERLRPIRSLATPARHLGGFEVGKESGKRGASTTPEGRPHTKRQGENGGAKKVPTYAEAAASGTVAEFTQVVNRKKEKRQTKEGAKENPKHQKKRAQGNLPRQRRLGYRQTAKAHTPISCSKWRIR